MEWYEDPVYIKMADCPEIQGQHKSWDKHDFYAFADGQNESPYHGIWLPMQAQLQEMVTPGQNLEAFHVGRANQIVSGLQDFRRMIGLEYTNQFDSMEQLWMAFVMHELHGKIWAGEAWA